VIFYGCFIGGDVVGRECGEICGVREEWKEKKEWRKVMGMIEEEGGIKSVCGRREGYDQYWVRRVLKLLGIHCHD
jgi:hypothetical protein